MKIVLIVGASGVGKDSLIRGAKALLAQQSDIKFISRYITRKPDENEDNIFLSKNEMSSLINSNYFVSHWIAHENIYAIAKSELGSKTNVISVSRFVVKDFESKFDNVFCINVKVDDDILKKRLLKRGREDSLQINERIKRSKKLFSAKNLIEFDNSGNLDENIIKFSQILQKIHNQDK